MNERTFIPIKARTTFQFTDPTIGVRSVLGTWSGFVSEPIIENQPDSTYFIYVQRGGATVRNPATGDAVWLRPGQYAVTTDIGDFYAYGDGIVIASSGYQGLFLIGGPIEATGRLKYIDGCTDTLLAPPVKLGDPCLNALYFPRGINQTAHTHPTVRIGIVTRGSGQCVTPDGTFHLTAGLAFVIPPGAVHAFRTEEEEMVVIAYHPDSDTGPTDDDHPMVNRTMVDGVSAAEIDAIRTR